MGDDIRGYINFSIFFDINNHHRVRLRTSTIDREEVYRFDLNPMNDSRLPIGQSIYHVIINENVNYNPLIDWSLL